MLNLITKHTAPQVRWAASARDYLAHVSCKNRTIAVLHNSRSCAVKHLPRYPGTSRALIPLAGLHLVSRFVARHFVLNTVAKRVKFQRRAPPGVHS